MEAYQQALGLVPGDARALEGHRAAAGRLAVLDQREEEARLLAARQAQVVELRRQADAATDAGDPVGAAAHLKAALALVNSAEDSQRLVQVLAAVERQEQERRRAARRFEADALEVEVRQALAEGRGQDAQEAVERIRGLDPEHPDLQDLTAAAATAVRRQRVAEARAVLSEAATPMAQASDLRRRLQNLEQERQQAALELAETPGPGLRARLQAAEQAIADARARRSMELARAVALLQQAWTKAPWDEAPSAALADFWIARLEEADSTDDEAAAAAAEAQARLYDTAGRHRTLIEGRAAVEVPAEASAVRLRALVPGPDRTLRPTGPEVVVPPGTRRDLVRGHWLAEGPPGTAQALHLERGAVVTVTLPTVSAVAGTAYIPTGRIYGRGGVPGPVVPAFRLARLEVTVGEWIEFLNAPSTQRRYEEALAEGHLILAPRAGYAADVPLWRRDGLLSQGRFLAERQDGTPIPLDLPVTGICPQDAREYAAWRATRDRLSWRLPTVAEWTLAVQGGDGRRFPWGEADDASLCSSGIQSREPHPVGSSPTDVSVQGVLDLAGSVSEFAQPEAGSSTFPLLGGNRLDRDPARLGWSQHREVDARYVHPAAGLRLALDARP